MKRRSFQQADQIRLRLQWLDRHFQPRPSLLESMFSLTPALPLCIAFIVGIVSSYWIAPNSTGLWSVCIIAIPAAVILMTAFRLPTHKQQLYAAGLGAVLIFVSFGVLRSHSIRYRGPDHLSGLVKDDRSLATIRGQVVSPVYYHQPREDFTSIPWLSSQSSFYLMARQVHTAEGWLKTSGQVRVTVTGNAGPIRPGQQVEIISWIDHFSPPMNPGQFDLAQYMHRKGVWVSATVNSAEGIRVLESGPSKLFQLRGFFYRFAADSLLDETLTDSNARSLSAALLLGERSDLTPAILSAFRTTGLAHFISLSGMHVGILAGSLWFLLKLCQIPKHFRAIVCILLIVIYALIVPPRAATLRAVLLSCLFLLALLFHRRTHPLNTLSLAAVVLLYARPYDLYSAGWQLSFLSVLGIIIFYRSVHYVLQDQVFFPIVLRLNGRFIRTQHFLYHISSLLAVGFSAWLCVFPVTLYYFGQLNPLSPLWTVLVLPFITGILYAGFLKIVLSVVLPTLSTLLGAVLYRLSGCLTAFVKILAQVDVFRIITSPPRLWQILFLYSLLAALCLLPYRSMRLRKICLISLILCLAVQPFLNRRRQPLEMICLSVGHGQAILLSTPDGQNHLFDAGSITHQDLTRKVIAPCLKSRGIAKLETVYLSHGDLDHLNALPNLVATVPIRHIQANAILIENTRSPSVEQQISGILESFSLGLETVREVKGHDYSIHSLWPIEAVAENPALSENDRSQMFLIDYADQKILLCGDIETYSQAAFLQQYPTLQVDVMVLPHHGSTANLNPDFIEQLSPSVIIASCSRRNAARAYQPPKQSAIQAFYTPVDGAVTIKIKADGTLCADGFLTSNQSSAASVCER